MKQIASSLGACLVWLLAACAPPGGLPGEFSGDAFPADYQGRATYLGSYRGVRTIYQGGQGNVVNASLTGVRVNLGNLIRPGLATNLQGDIQFTLVIDGSNVQLGYRSRSGSLGSGAVRGVRVGNRCTFNDGVVEWHSICGPDRFGGDYASQQRNGSIRLNFVATPTEIISRAEQERQVAAAKAALQARISAMSPLQRSVENVLQQDSNSWILNRYDIASVSNIRVLRQGGGERVVAGDYTVNGGRPMAATVQFAQDRPRCIEISDFPGNCRAIGRPPSHGVAIGLFAAALSSGTSGSSSDSSSAHDNLGRAAAANGTARQAGQRVPFPGL